MPSLCITGGIIIFGSVNVLSSVRNFTVSFLTLTFTGQFVSSIQLSINSFNAVGSKIAPDKMCAPTSEPFSTTHTEKSLLFSLHFFLKFIAADKPDGPAPTTTRSYSIFSLVIFESVIVILLKYNNSYNIYINEC